MVKQTELENTVGFLLANHTCPYIYHSGNNDKQMKLEKTLDFLLANHDYRR